jgi:DNA-binding transcriptional ArsR family regulator
MFEEPPMARMGALIGSPVRASILTLLFDGRAMTATELANAVGAAPATTSEHLGLLLAGGLVAREKSGRHHYYSLANADVAEALERLAAALAPAIQPNAATRPKPLKPIQRARFCYDHIAGRLGVALADRLLELGALDLAGDHYQVTQSGEVLLAELGVCLASARAKKRIFAKQCLDWSERRHHIAGALGAALGAALMAKGWVRRAAEPRVLIVTPDGKGALGSRLGISLS